ncbi:lycopene cyclase domain-containing protein [Curtobacterium sp. TXMA1]|uniref:lycopene cyclase domain-containing protein n=1 Tax=Curtobacterium sp. TXMA1 TaxID=2876939 RepID=UPI001CCED575|nr:lycopene cyclase domain-containing protein [Curtobacterium sp. TXMA1]UBQ02984.1 lycopene cyclase domain-containing protein [Curtobacterium sp. TXMA1]
MTGPTTYALLAVPFLAFAALVAVAAGVVAARRRGTGRRRAGIVGGVVSAVVAGVVLLVMTGVFNNVIVGLGIVAYDDALISGARVGLFPVEDLAYSIGAVLLLPSCWVLLERPRDRSSVHPTVRGAGRGTGTVGTPTQPPRRPEETP